jgi:MFS family permease
LGSRKHHGTPAAERSRRIPRRPDWSTAAWWGPPIGRIYFATLVLSVGRGAWYTCWALFFIRSVGLSAAEFGIGVTAAGVVGMIAGTPFGYLADRLGPREVLIGLSAVQGLATLTFFFATEFWTVMVVTCVVVTAERSAPGIRIAVISGLTTNENRLSTISNCHVIKEVGAVAGALIGGVVLFADNAPAYLGLIMFCGAANVFFALLLIRVPHVRSLRERKVKRKVLVLKDRPFLVLTLLNGMVALNWGVLDSGLPLWITTHTQAKPWVMAALLIFNGIMIVLLLSRVTRAGATVAGAGRLGMLAGIALALACVVFATSDGGSGAAVLVILFAAVAVHTAGELFFLGSGYGLSVGLTPEDAHGEYQGMFNAGEGAAMMLAPGLLTALLVGWGTGGWLLLAGVFLLSGTGLMITSRWALRHRDSLDAKLELVAEPAPLTKAA